MKRLTTIKQIEKELERVVWSVNSKIDIDKSIWWTGSLSNSIMLTLDKKPKEWITD